MVVRTVNDKHVELEARTEERRRLGKAIDRVVSQRGNAADVAEAGCAGDGVCPTVVSGLVRLLGISRRAVPSSDVAEAPVAKRAGNGFSNAMLGLSKKKTPAVKLEAAASAMKTRLEQIEIRAAEAREAAQRAMQSGNKAAALRDLKRCKGLEQQALSMQGVLASVEQQSDMLEQTALQRQVASALGETAKSLKREKGLLNKAEDAVDSAIELKDLHEDLNQVMNGLATADASYDDDDLLQELDDMMAVPNDAAPERPSSEQLRQEAERRATSDAFELARRLPSAPKTKLREEKHGLLLAQ